MRKMIQLSTSIFWPHKTQVLQVNWIQKSALSEGWKFVNSKIQVSEYFILSVLKKIFIPQEPSWAVSEQLLERNVPETETQAQDSLSSNHQIKYGKRSKLLVEALAKSSILVIVHRSDRWRHSKLVACQLK